jgi:N-acetylmuramoyl-L-alanine amidase
MEPLDPWPDSVRACDRAPSGARSPENLLARAIARGDFRGASRRDFLLAAGIALPALAFLGCAPARSTTLPGAAWARADDLGPTPRPSGAVGAAAAPRVVPEQNPIAPAALPYARPRMLWARGEPDYKELNPMLPVTAITVHHDGLDSLVRGTSAREMTDRIELYRVGHRAQGWADIGYHLVIDRAGTLWQGRSIRWQGAHVKFRNEGNIGVLVMGNFDLQQPAAAQKATLERVLVDLMRTYGVPQSRVYTHREWPDAKTACPGRSLQSHMAGLRASRRLARGEAGITAETAV